jgi:hypothetical protein
MWGCEVWTVPSTDLLTNLEDLVFSEHNYLWISFSRSGDSSEGLAIIEAAIERYPQVRHLLVTCKRRRHYELDLLEEINRKKLGKWRAVVTPDSIDPLDHLVDNVFSLQVPNLRDEYRAPLGRDVGSVPGAVLIVEVGTPTRLSQPERCDQ